MVMAVAVVFGFGVRVGVGVALLRGEEDGIGISEMLGMSRIHGAASYLWSPDGDGLEDVAVLRWVRGSGAWSCCVIAGRG
jgi:hypothetical protein